jgi:glutamate N-acetyltransferase / amino-acid N-acetyltransferase
VKTAIAGEDANWGRVVMAVGKAGEPADRDKLSIWFGDIRVARQGRARSGLRRGRGLAYMKNERSSSRSISARQGPRPVWTCDLTKEYVAINGDYRSTGYRKSGNQAGDETLSPVNPIEPGS